MDRKTVLDRIYLDGVVVVIRGNSVDEAINTIEACVKGGIKIIEITFTNPYALEVLQIAAKKYKITDVIIGCGTVLDVETARIAILNGAEFVVSPMLDIEILKLCNRYSIAVCPGIATPTELKTALEYGVELVKLFPADIFKPNGLKAMKAPFPNAKIMPTGGVTLDNLGDWFKAGAYCVGAGSMLTKGAEKGDFDQVEKQCKEFVDIIRKVRK